MSDRSLLRCLVIASIFAWVGCGGGSSSGGAIGPPPPVPSFTLSLSSTTVALPQNATQDIQVKAEPQNGFSGSVTVTAAGMPSGVTISPSSLVLPAGSTGTLMLSATSSATSGTSQVSLTGVSGSQQASAELALNVIPMAIPVAMPFTTTGGGIEKAYYDEARQLLFASNLFLNEVDVLSGKDLSLQARIPVGQPFGIDQMPDGNTLVIGTATQGFYTINENTLAVTHYLAPNFSQLYPLSTMVLLTPVAMTNGKVLFLGKEVGLSPDGIFIYGGQAIIEWDSGTGQFSQAFYIPFLSLEIDDLKRSADHNWAVFAADKLYIYSAATDSIVSSAAPVNSAPYGVRDVAASPNGSQFAVVSAFSVSFYDSAFNALGTVDLGPSSGLVFAHYNSQYSADGKFFYWELSGSVLDVLSTTSYTEIGSVTSDYGSQTQFEPNLLLVDSLRRAFFSALGGVGVLDCSTLRTGPLNVAGGLAPNPSAIPLNQTVSVTLNATNRALPLGTSVTIGGQLLPVQLNSANNNSFVVQIPPSSVPGPVDLVLTQPDGESLIEPDRFVYGVEVAGATATLVPPIGNPAIALFGYGMLNGPSTPPTVTVGGQTVTNLVVNPYANNILQELFLQLPSGPPGPADISVIGNNGASTLKSVITYIPAATIIPAAGLLQVLYDTHRNLLYALQSTQIQVLDPTSLTWESPLRPGGSGGAGYVSMAITPDGSKLLVLDATSNSVTVFDPDNPSQSVTTVLPTSAGATVQSIAVTSTGKAFIGSRNSYPIEFDLVTNTSTLLNNLWLAKFVATADGTNMVAVNETDTSGTIAVWHSASDSFTSQGLSNVIWTDAAVSADGNLIAAVKGELSYSGVAVGLFDGGLHFANATVYPDLAPPDEPFCTGAIFSKSGLTLLSPLGDSIDFFNTETGTMVGRLLTPELLPVGDASAGVLALDPNQQTIYAISESGLIVLTLPTGVDQIKPFPWPHVTKTFAPVPVSAENQKGQHSLVR